MNLISFRLDRDGVREILRGPEARRLVDTTAGEVAANVRALIAAGTSVDVTSYTTDRAAAAVAIVDVRGMGWQARDGVLTRAAGLARLEVREWRNAR
ncbi:hypothetical protein AB0D78_28160 [Streptomyces avermitilis]|uniref:hypothetical protein n=1 Tax=Streptomyces avermitilis TaxID=33903 RepID=UPI0033F4140B